MNLALARLANKLSSNKGVTFKQKRAGYEVLFVRRWLCSKEVLTSDDKSAVVDEAGSESKVTPVTNMKSRKNLIWNIINRDKDFVPALYVHFPSGLGDAIIQATNNFNQLFVNKSVLKNVGPVKELEDCYKMRYLGISKGGLKVEVKDGLLMVKDENDFDDEKWGWSFGCYEKALVLPKDAKADEIKAELKNGVLNVVVPKKKDVKELPSS